MSPESCVVLVPCGGSIERRCEDGLRVLEQRGYTVRRVPGFSAIDVGRSVIASQALRDGFAELMWIDSDVAFDPDDVNRLRGHGLPIACGLLPKKGPRQFAADFLPDTDKVLFGRHGGLTEVRYAGFGFVHTRREVYEAVRTRLELPACNQRFGPPIVPYFLPMLVPDGAGQWYLAEDYSFCERARRCGYRVMADTSVRLWHVGSYLYGWEDAGRDVERFASYTFHRPGAKSATPADHDPVRGEFSRDWFSWNIPLWTDLLAPLAGRPVRALEIGVFEGRSTVWLMEHVLTHPESRLTYIDTFEGGSDHAGMSLAGLEGRFRANTERFRGRLVEMKGRSQDRLKELARGTFDLIYVDGSHEPADVLADAILSWMVLKPGGLLGFDDYDWRRFPEPGRRPPQVAIDAFLRKMTGHFELLHKGRQVWVRKLR